MRIHFIAIGGSVMHSMAIAMQNKGYQVSGSDDEIFEPSYSRLKETGLLPAYQGWNAKNITPDIDTVIVGKHATLDNPELQKAKALGLNLYSFPEYVYQQSINKQRIVVAGSHGKTTVTAMLMHVFKSLNKDFDYVIGAKVAGFEHSVKLTKDAPIILIEGDEYATSALDDSPKFLHYKQHIGVITGVAWDHINIYPTYEKYLKQFRIFIEQAPRAGTLAYHSGDAELKKLIKTTEINSDVFVVPYQAHKNLIKKNQTLLIDEFGNKIPASVFGDHNMQNLNAAFQVTSRLGIKPKDFYEAISTFKGANMRLQLLASNTSTMVFKDFAHAPSKVQATVEAVKKQYKRQMLIACLELHTFSSLDADFIANYKNTMLKADVSIVYIDPKAATHKKLRLFSEGEIKKAFNNPNLLFFTNSETLEKHLLSLDWQDNNLLLMSSGNFGGMDLTALSQKVAT